MADESAPFDYESVVKHMEARLLHGMSDSKFGCLPPKTSVVVGNHIYFMNPKVWRQWELTYIPDYWKDDPSGYSATIHSVTDLNVNLPRPSGC